MGVALYVFAEITVYESWDQPRSEGWAGGSEWETRVNMFFRQLCELGTNLQAYTPKLLDVGGARAVKTIYKDDTGSPHRFRGVQSKTRAA
jgi:hypothetical protein